MLGIKPGPGGSGSKNANHCAMLAPGQCWWHRGRSLAHGCLLPSSIPSIDRNNFFQSSHRSSALVSATLTFDDGLCDLPTFLALFSKLKRIFRFSSLFLCAQLKKLFFLSLFSLCPFSLLELSNQTRTALYDSSGERMKKNIDVRPHSLLT